MSESKGKQKSADARTVSFKVVKDWLAFYLDQLKPRGQYGETRTEIVQSLVRDQINALIEKKQLKRIDD